MQQRIDEDYGFFDKLEEDNDLSTPDENDGYTTDESDSTSNDDIQSLAGKR